MQDDDSHGPDMDKAFAEIAEAMSDPPDDGVPPIGEEDMPVPEDQRPTFELHNGDGYAATEFAVSAIAGDPNIYQRGRRLVTVARAAELPEQDDIHRDPEQPVIVEVPASRVGESLSRRVRFLKFDNRTHKKEPRDPPPVTVTAVHQRGDYPGVRPLLGIAGAPIFRPDGTVWATPGYDPKTGFYYAPSSRPPKIPDAPSQDDARKAYTDLLEAIVDFPLVDDDARAAWVASLLSVVGWHAFPGGAPLFLFDANTPGTGKSLVADVASVIARGCEVARSAAVEDDSEMRKRITTHVISGDPLVLIDNLPTGSLLGTSSLDAALTARTWQDRRLGVNESVSLPMQIVWMASGNNVGIKADAARRVLRSRIECPDERPELRAGFRHMPLLQWVRGNRTRLLGAALTLLRAFFVAGRPRHDKGPALGSFEAWDGIIRAAVIWAGGGDPVKCSAAADASIDPEAVAHRQLLGAWHKSTIGTVTAAELLQEVAAQPAAHEDLRTALMELCPSKDGGTPNPRRLGYKLRALRGRWRTVDGATLSLVQAGADKGSVKWRVALQTKQGVMGAMGAIKTTVGPQNGNIDLPFSPWGSGKITPITSSPPASEPPRPDPRCPDDDDRDEVDDDDEVPF